MHEAILYEKLAEEKTQCNRGRHRCVIQPGQRGICGVRENQEGRLYTLVFDRIAAEGVDPIEKKPFFHFLPGSLAFSVATMGCNFHCRHCQNCHLSRTPADEGVIQGRSVSPTDLVAAAEARGCRSISFTYSEPTVFAELALCTARIAKDRGLFNTFVTNGYQTPELIGEMKGCIDAANVDLKGFSERFYRKICGADLKGVLDTIARMHDAGIWLEITTLLIPGLNDGSDELEGIATFIARLDPDIPWHVSRYHPAYKMHDHPPTPVEGLLAAQEIGRSAGLKYVFIGNVPGDKGENSYCHACGRTLIRRHGFTVRRIDLENGRCPNCGTRAAIRFE